MQSNPQCSARDAACLRDVTTTAMDGTTLARLSQAHSEERERAPARKEERERAVIAQSFLESIKDDTSHVTRTRNVSLRASRSLLYHRRHGLLQQRSDRVRGLCPVLDPLLDGFRVEVRLLRQRVVVPKLLQGKAFALPARVDGDQPVEWTLLSSHSLESKLAPGERERERERERKETKKRGRQSSARPAIPRPRPSLRSHLHPRGCLHSRSHVRRVQRSLPQLRSSHVGPEGHAPHVRARSGGWRRHGCCRSSSPHVCVSSLSLPRARGQPEPLSSCALLLRHAGFFSLLLLFVVYFLSTGALKIASFSCRNRVLTGG